MTQLSDELALKIANGVVCVAVVLEATRLLLALDHVRFASQVSVFAVPFSYATPPLVLHPVTAPPPPPPPPARAEAVEVLSVTVVVPLTRLDMRTRTEVYPATFACHVPVEVVELAAVALFDGVAFKATQVAPPFAVASN